MIATSCSPEEEKILDSGEERAAQSAVLKLDSLLDLTDAQEKAVYILALQGAQQITQYKMRSADMSLAEKAKVVNGMTASFEEELKKVLTEAQWELFLKSKAERRTKKLEKLQEKWKEGAIKPVPMK
jgi:hypothetical protein